MEAVEPSCSSAITWNGPFDPATMKPHSAKFEAAISHQDPAKVVKLMRLLDDLVTSFQMNDMREQ